MTNDIVSRVRKIADAFCDDITHNTRSCLTEAVNEIERLQALLKEIVPYLLHDVECALEMGPPPEAHDDNCDDCRWYRKALAWKARIDAGDIGDVAPYA